MAVLTPQQNAKSGVVVNYVAADVAGDKAVNNGKLEIRVKNAAGAPIDVTINSQVNCNYGFDHNEVVAVANGTEKTIGLLDPARFNNSSGQVEWSYSSITSITTAVVQN